MADDTASWTHDRLQSDLYRKRRAAKATLAWSEVQVPGTDGGRFDVFACRSHDAKRTDTWQGFEVKATLPDLESDLSTGKWRRYLPACDEFSFALGPDLANHIDRIPDGPGVMVLAGDRWQWKRKPTGGHRTVADLDIWKRLATRDHWTPTEQPMSRLERMEQYERMESLSYLLNGRVRSEILRESADLRRRAIELDNKERRVERLEDLERRLDGVPEILGCLGAMLQQGARRVNPGWDNHDHRTVTAALDLLLSGVDGMS